MCCILGTLYLILFYLFCALEHKSESQKLPFAELGGKSCANLQ